MLYTIWHYDHVKYSNLINSDSRLLDDQSKVEKQYFEKLLGSDTEESARVAKLMNRNSTYKPIADVFTRSDAVSTKELSLVLLKAENSNDNQGNWLKDDDVTPRPTVVRARSTSNGDLITAQGVNGGVWLVIATGFKKLA